MPSTGMSLCIGVGWCHELQLDGKYSRTASHGIALAALDGIMPGADQTHV